MSTAPLSVTFGRRPGSPRWFPEFVCRYLSTDIHLNAVYEPKRLTHLQAWSCRAAGGDWALTDEQCQRAPPPSTPDRDRRPRRKVPGGQWIEVQGMTRPSRFGMIFKKFISIGWNAERGEGKSRCPWSTRTALAVPGLDRGQPMEVVLLVVIGSVLPRCSVPLSQTGLIDGAPGSCRTMDPGQARPDPDTPVATRLCAPAARTIRRSLDSHRSGGFAARRCHVAALLWMPAGLRSRARQRRRKIGGGKMLAVWAVVARRVDRNLEQGPLAQWNESQRATAGWLAVPETAARPTPHPHPTRGGLSCAPRSPRRESTAACILLSFRASDPAPAHCPCPPLPTLSTVHRCRRKSDLRHTNPSPAAAYRLCEPRQAFFPRRFHPLFACRAAQDTLAPPTTLPRHHSF